jgi:hypothetical protein
MIFSVSIINFGNSWIVKRKERKNSEENLLYIKIMLLFYFYK